jgi:NTE family protein
MRIISATCSLMALLLFAGGCASYPANARLMQSDASSGYRFRNLAHPGNSDSLQVFLAFSGGGTRAAALSYGVLEALSRTDIIWEGQHRRLLDEVDYISAVSGGSFTAAYYALYGDGIFTNFESRFLNQNIQLKLFWRLCLPTNWVRLASPYFDRSDMVAEYYDRHVFGGKTFEDLVKRNRRPFVSLNATDISLNATFQFSQDQFDFLCSDLSPFPVARAVAASAAFPIVLSPVTLNNYVGSCDLPEPSWMALTTDHVGSRGAQRMRELRAYRDVARHRYVHLLDGGLADNLGLRGPFEGINAIGSVRRVADVLNLKRPDKVVIIVVNAANKIDHGWGRRKAAPSALEVALDLSSIPMSRYSFETIEIVNESAKRWEAEWNEPNSTREPSAGGGASGVPPHVRFYVVEVSFEVLQDDAERHYFETLPTSFHLPTEAVTRLRAVAGKLLRQSVDYRALLHDIGGENQTR